jgi:ABC-type sugar transport system ATPase subunit/ribose/xylose/arabinose/galactoside ABC-type transport system permease subunit
VADRSVPLVELVDVTKRFPGVAALAGVSLELARGEVHALVGENGAGKSTLINVISGVIAPDGGHLRLDGQTVRWASPVDARRQGIVTVHQEAELFPPLTVAENMALERGLPVSRGGWVRWRQIFADARRAVDLLGEPMDVGQQAAALSVAERQLTQVAAAVCQQARVLVLDEPTSALTAAESDWLFRQIRRLKEQGVGILYISHRQEEIFELADRITVLRDGVRVWTGPRQAIDRAGLLQQMVGRGGADHDAPRERRPAAHGEIRLEVRDLSDAAGRFTDISLAVQKGEIVGIYGLIGSGRSELAQGLFALRPTRGGSVRVDGRAVTLDGPAKAVAAGLAYLPEDRLRQGIFRGLSVRANTVVSALRLLARHSLTSAARERAATAEQVTALGIKCRGTEQPIAELSGGNQQKVVFARWLLTRPAVLILDEPTRGVDIRAKAEIHHLLRDLAEAGTAVLLISSELPEVLQHADRVVVFRAGRIVAEYPAGAATAERITAAALPVGAAAAAQARSSPNRRWRRGMWRTELALAATNALLMGVLAMTSDAFLTGANLGGMLASTSVLMMLSLGAASVIMAGAIDISIGAVLALAAAVAGLVLQRPYAPLVTIPAAIAASLAVGLAAGWTNALLSLRGRVHPIVITLGTMTIYRGLLISLTGGDTITDLPQGFVQWSSATVLGINGSVVVGLAVAVVMYVWLGYVRSGRHLIAYGASPTAARLVGISQGRTWLAAFGAGGLLAALAGIVELSQTGSLQSGTGTGYELQAIAAAVIGGVSIAGGRGTVVGVCLGALLLGLIQNGLVLWQVSRFHYSLVIGGLLLAAILMDMAWRRGER